MNKGIWYRAECVSTLQPPVREDDISEYVVYLRKDFKYIPETVDSEGHTQSAKWTYLETTVPKEVAQLLDMTDKNSTDIADIEDAICILTSEGRV